MMLSTNMPDINSSILFKLRTRSFGYLDTNNKHVYYQPLYAQFSTISARHARYVHGNFIAVWNLSVPDVYKILRRTPTSERFSGAQAALLAVHLSVHKLTAKWLNEIHEYY